MKAYTPDFSLAVEGVAGNCPAGEIYADIDCDKRIVRKVHWRSSADFFGRKKIKTANETV